MIHTRTSAAPCLPKHTNQLSQHLEPRAAAPGSFPGCQSRAGEPRCSTGGGSCPSHRARSAGLLCTGERETPAENTWQLHGCHIPAQGHLLRPSITTETRTQTPDLEHETMQEVLIYTIIGPCNSTLHNLILKKCFLFKNASQASEST